MEKKSQPIHTPKQHPQQQIGHTLLQYAEQLNTAKLQDAYPNVAVRVALDDGHVNTKVSRNRTGRDSDVCGTNSR